MAKALFRSLRRVSSLVKPSSSIFPGPNFHSPESVFFSSRHTIPLNLPNPSWVFRNLSHGTVNLVISEGKPKFEMHEVDPPKKEKWQTKKRLKMKRKREKQKRKEANKRDPRSLTVKRKKQKFANAEERIKYKLERRSNSNYEARFSVAEMEEVGLYGWGKNDNININWAPRARRNRTWNYNK